MYNEPKHDALPTKPLEGRDIGAGTEDEALGNGHEAGQSPERVEFRAPDRRSHARTHHREDARSGGVPNVKGTES